MQKLFKRISSVLIAIVMCLGITAVVHTAAAVVADAATDYYAPITAKSGTQLLGQLHDLITNTHKTYTSYDSIKEHAYVTDPGLDGKGVLEFYTHETVMNFSGTLGTWNREHVWCQSNSNGMWGTSGGGSDLHHIRPTEGGLNSTRGNDKYGEVSGGKEAWSRLAGGANSRLGGHYSGGTFEPLDNVKGDVARIVMYVYTHYNKYNNSIFGGYATTNGKGGSFGTLNFTHIISASNENAAIQLLLKWNREDKVDQIETLRNEEVYKIQGNRNPFIDNQDYADAIWGGSVTPGPDNPTPSALTGLTVSPSSLNLKVGESANLTVTATPSTASNSVSWSSSNTVVATVSNGTVTAKAEGTATITATSTVNQSIKKSITVTVTRSATTPPSPPAEEKTGSITIDRDSFTDTTGAYGFYGWSTKNGVSGTAYIYAGTANKIQFSNKKQSYYLASTTPTSAPITSVTVTLAENTKNWKLLTSSTAYTELSSGNPSDGTDHGTKAVTTAGTTWTVSGKDTYFALVYDEQQEGASYIKSITVTFADDEGGGGPPVTPPDPSVKLESLSLNHTDIEFAVGNSVKLEAIPEPSNASAEVIWTSSDTSVVTVAEDGTLTAVAAGQATITATSKDNPEISISTKVTVKANDTPVTPEPGNTDDFYKAISAIEGTLSERYAAIINAIAAYNELSASDKDAVKPLLISKINAYNEDVRAADRQAKDAENAALNGILR